MNHVPNTIKVFELLNISLEAVEKDLNAIVNAGGRVISVYKSTRYSHHVGDLDCVHVVVDVREMNPDVGV